MIRLFGLNLVHLFITALIGLVLGLERKYHPLKRHRKVTVGPTVFIGTALIGFIAVEIIPRDGILPELLIIFFLMLFLSIPVLKQRLDTPGLTTAVAVMLVFLTGVLMGHGLVLHGVFTGAITLLLTASKRETHRFAELLSHEELYSAIRFLALAAILLPLAYSVGDVHALVGPGEVFDTVKTLWMIVFVSSISFASYLIIKAVGAEKGLELSAFLGGFVSSAASTAFLSQKAKKGPALRGIPCVGVMLTNTSMIMKDTVVIAMLAGFVFLDGIKLLLAVVLGASGVLLLYMMKDRELGRVSGVDLELGTPFAVVPAIKFGLIFGLLSVLIYGVQTYVGGWGVYSVALGGVISTTSVTASLGLMFAGGKIGLHTTMLTFLLTMVVGTLSKLGIVFVYDKRLARELASPLISLSVVVISLVGFLTFMAK